MVIAAVTSPIPDAPITQAAGAENGYIYGTLYVVVGAEIGALITFGLGQSLSLPIIFLGLGILFLARRQSSPPKC